MKTVCSICSLSLVLVGVLAFQAPSSSRHSPRTFQQQQQQQQHQQRRRTTILGSSLVEEDATQTKPQQQEQPTQTPTTSSNTDYDDNNNDDNNKNNNRQYWEIGPTSQQPNPRPLTPKLLQAMETNTHPTQQQELEEELGRGTYITADWRKAWYNYQSPSHDPTLMNDDTGYAYYAILSEDIIGTIPDDLVGVLYRNGAGKFGVNGERVAHVLDADGLVFQITIGPPVNDDNDDDDNDDNDDAKQRQVTFRSKFVQTKGFLEEQKTQQFTSRGTFGTMPRGLTSLFPSPQKGINEDPSNIPLLSRMAGNFFQTEIKNSANTHVVSFGGKLLALFEAGLPYSLDPVTLDTLGEDTMGGMLPQNKLALKFSSDIPSEYQPDYMGGGYHTAHPKMCSRTGHLVGWHWTQLMPSGSLEVTFTEWSPKDFSPVASKSFELENCELAPHDMAMTENCIIFLVNSLQLNQLPYLLGMQGPAASLTMDGRAPVYAHVFPRPTSSNQFEPFMVQVPPNFSIHFSHAYEDEITGNIVAFFSGWPPSDSKDFLGAWGGFCPSFDVIPPTLLWRLEIDPQSKTCVDLNIAPGAINSCSEHVVIHPNFATRKAKYVYAICSNLIGDSSAPNGYAKHCVEDGSNRPLQVGEFNHEIDAYWFGSRYFTDEPLVVPKQNGNPEKEEEAYLLGMVYDAAKHRSFLAIFDLERNLKEGPIARLYLRSHIPHGLHGCFAAEPGLSSVFC